MIVLCAVAFLLWSHVDVHSYTVPYITFMGETLPNNSFLDVSLVLNDGSAGVQCHTDLTTCCSRHQGNDSGDWYAPDSVTKLPFLQSNSLNAAFERRESQRVTLYRSYRSSIVFQSGIYRCDIAVNGSKRGTVYAGLYDTGGIYVSFCLHSLLKMW